MHSCLILKSTLTFSPPVTIWALYRQNIRAIAVLVKNAIFPDEKNLSGKEQCLVYPHALRWALCRLGRLE